MKLKYFLISFISLITIKLFAFDSKITISIDEMKENQIVLGASGKIKDQMLPVAARIIQLQLNEANCENVTVLQSSMTASDMNGFSITSKNCIIKKKKNDICESGFVARNIPVNPRTPDDTIIGGDTYKICIKDKENVSSEKPSSNK